MILSVCQSIADRNKERMANLLNSAKIKLFEELLDVPMEPALCLMRLSMIWKQL